MMSIGITTDHGWFELKLSDATQLIRQAIQKV